MDPEEFRRYGKEMVDYVADYLENIRDRRPFPDVSPGYLKELIPDKAPDEAEKWEDVMKDVERVIMPGVGHFNFTFYQTIFMTFESIRYVVK
jgi:aromatic-L-amino-acid decarboxylase